MEQQTHPTSSLVNACDLGKRFASGVEALTGVDLEIHRGEFVSIVGPSGCGKSTLLRLVSGLTPPTAGSLTVDGRMPLEARRTRQELAYMKLSFEFRHIIQQMFHHIPIPHLHQLHVVIVIAK